MMNTNYAPEIASANKFIIDHNTDMNLMAFLREMEESNFTHSQIWSNVYDYMAKNYPAATGSLITGLAYWIES